MFQGNFPLLTNDVINQDYTACHTLKQVKQNATNNLAPFFKSAFNALSDDMLHFAHCVAP